MPVCPFSNYILEVSSGMEEMGGVNWKLALCLLLAWAIVLVCLIRGVQSLGKVSLSLPIYICHINRIYVTMYPQRIYQARSHTIIIDL